MKRSVTKNRQGFILITVLVFITIVSLSTMSALQNIGHLTVTQPQTMHHYQAFYLREARLSDIENMILGDTYKHADLDALLLHKNILDQSSSKVLLSEEALWRQTHFIQELGDSRFIISYSGKRYLDFEEAFVEDEYAWVFQIHLRERLSSSTDLISQVELYPQELMVAFSEKGIELEPGRRAWFDP